MKRMMVLVLSLTLLVGGIGSIAGCGSANGSGGTSSSSRPGY
jgi:hypothetical protein